MFSLTIKELITAAVISIIIGFQAWEKWREYKKRKMYDLSPNPDRCADHENRLRAIEKDCASMVTNQAVMAVKMDTMNTRLDNIGKAFSVAGDHEV